MKSRKVNPDVMVNDYNFTQDIRDWNRKNDFVRYKGDYVMPGWMRGVDDGFTRKKGKDKQ